MNTKQTIAGLVLVLATWSASADPVTFNFTGRVISTSFPLYSAFPPGTPVTGSYTYDTDLVDAFPGSVANDHFTPHSPAANQALNDTFDLTVTVGAITRSSSNNLNSPLFQNHYVQALDTFTEDRFLFQVNGQVSSDDTGSLFLRDHSPRPPDAIATGSDNLTDTPMTTAPDVPKFSDNALLSPLSPSIWSANDNLSGDFLGSVTFRIDSIALAGPIKKEITRGPDNDLDEEIDLVVEVGQPQTTEYAFDITYNDPDGPDVLIIDTLPAEWVVESIEGVGTGLPLECGESSSFTSNFGTIVVFNDGKKKKEKKCKGATHIEWLPLHAAGGAVEVVATTRSTSSGKKNVNFAPKSCGALYLNDGALVFEIDPETNDPLVDSETGEVLPPIFESIRLCLAAVRDLNGGGLVGNGSGDEDGDTFSDYAEACGPIQTDPCVYDADTDADRIPDSVDNCPYDSNFGQEDADGDGIGDAC